MSEQKESSVLFSLKELMNLEEDRIKSEEAEKAAAAAAAERARLDAERSAREAEEARIRSEEERRRLDEARAREEAARIEAIRHAEIEKARTEAENRARLEAMAAQQQHERNLAAIKQDESKKKLRNLLIGGVAVVVLGGSLAGYFIYQSSVRGDQERAALAQRNADAEAELKKKDAQAKEQSDKVNALLAQLARAKDDAEKAKLQKQLEEEKAKQDEMAKGGRRGGGGPAKAGGGDAPKPKCRPGDPLCTDI